MASASQFKFYAAFEKKKWMAVFKKVIEDAVPNGNIGNQNQFKGNKKYNRYSSKE